MKMQRTKNSLAEAKDEWATMAGFAVIAREVGWEPTMESKWAEFTERLGKPYYWSYFDSRQELVDTLIMFLVAGR